MKDHTTDAIIWRHEMESAMSGHGTWFTSHLLRLIAKADHENMERIRLGFPASVAAYERWQSSSGEWAR